MCLKTVGGLAISVQAFSVLIWQMNTVNFFSWCKVCVLQSLLPNFYGVQILLSNITVAVKELDDNNAVYVPNMSYIWG